MRMMRKARRKRRKYRDLQKIISKNICGNEMSVHSFVPGHIFQVLKTVPIVYAK